MHQRFYLFLIIQKINHYLSLFKQFRPADGAAIFMHHPKTHSQLVWAFKQKGESLEIILHFTFTLYFVFLFLEERLSI